MDLTSQKLARMIDISAVQAFHGEAEIAMMVADAKRYGFGSIHTLPSWVGHVRDMLSDYDNILVGSPIGFPSGGHTTEIKLMEAKGLLADGAQELDLMMNLGKFLSGQYDYVQSEITGLVDIAGNVPLKVILEVHYLNTEQIKKACELCINAGAAYVKTGTGWSPSGATLEVISLITGFVENRIRVKAAGGIRDLNTLLKMVRMGVTRFGINQASAVDILRKCQALPGGIVAV